MLGVVCHLILDHQGTLGEELAYRTVLSGALQAALFRCGNGAMQSDRFPHTEAACISAGRGLYLKVDADILKGDLATGGNAYHGDHGSGRPRCYRQVRGRWAHHVPGGMWRVRQEGPGAPLSRLRTDDRVHRTTDDRPGDNAP
jgi:hypothetical protein